MGSHTVVNHHYSPFAGSQDLLDALHKGEPNAAERLYHHYASGVRFFLRRSHTATPLDDAVLRVLIETTRRLRADEVHTTEQLTATVLQCTHREARRLAENQIAQPPAKPGLSLLSHAELVNGVFSQLTADEREIMMRTYLLNQQDSVISREMDLAIDEILQARQRGRDLFRKLIASLKIN